MKISTMIQISKIVLLAVAVSLAVLSLIFALQHTSLIGTLATVSWNG